VPLQSASELGACLGIADFAGARKASQIQNFMSKTFRAWSLDQALLLPPSVHDFVPAGHLSRFVVALVTEELDLSAIVASYRGRRASPYHPAMMVALLLYYAYAVGTYSSRRIAKACVERVDFMAIVALDAPDFRTISEFRRRHLAALSRCSSRCWSCASGPGWRPRRRSASRVRSPLPSPSARRPLP
jgi:transposase